MRLRVYVSVPTIAEEAAAEALRARGMVPIRDATFSTPARPVLLVHRDSHLSRGAAVKEETQSVLAALTSAGIQAVHLATDSEGPPRGRTPVWPVLRPQREISNAIGWLDKRLRYGGTIGALR